MDDKLTWGENGRWELAEAQTSQLRLDGCYGLLLVYLFIYIHIYIWILLGSFSFTQKYLNASPGDYVR